MRVSGTRYNKSLFGKEKDGLGRFPLIKAVIPLLGLCACAPQIVTRPYPVEVVREVAKPIPREFTDPLTAPALPEGGLTVLTLVEHIKAWQAWGKTVNDHRARAAELSKGHESDAEESAR